MTLNEFTRALTAFWEDLPAFESWAEVHGLTAEEASEILGTPLTEEE